MRATTLQYLDQWADHHASDRPEVSRCIKELLEAYVTGEPVEHAPLKGAKPVEVAKPEPDLTHLVERIAIAAERSATAAEATAQATESICSHLGSLCAARPG